MSMTKSICYPSHFSSCLFSFSNSSFLEITHLYCQGSQGGYLREPELVHNLAQCLGLFRETGNTCSSSASRRGGVWKEGRKEGKEIRKNMKEKRIQSNKMQKNKDTPRTGGFFCWVWGGVGWGCYRGVWVVKQRLLPRQFCRDLLLFNEVQPVL